MKNLEKISPLFVMLDGTIYTVKDYAIGLTDGFKIGTAYKMNFMFLKAVIPYRGKRGKDDRTGLYTTPNGYIVPYVKPGDNLKHYGHDIISSLNTVSVITDKDVIMPDISESSGKVFKPIINNDDDLSLKLLRSAILMKKIDLDSYTKRFQRMDVGSNASNRKTNAKKALINNRSLSATKLVQFADVFDLEVAILLKDAKNAANPMNPNNLPVAIFSRRPFDCSQFINISDLNLDLLYAVDDEDDDYEIMED
jgi:hypothetical protein